MNKINCFVFFFVLASNLVLQIKSQKPTGTYKTGPLSIEWYDFKKYTTFKVSSSISGDLLFYERIIKVIIANHFI